MRIVSPIPLYKTEKMKNRKVLRKIIGRSVVIPGQTEQSNKSTYVFHNIRPDLEIFIKYRNGLIVPMIYQEVDAEERGVFIIDKFNGLHAFHGKDATIIKKSIFTSETFLETYDDIENGLEAMVENVLAERETSHIDTVLTSINRSVNDSNRDMKDILTQTRELRDYKFISVEDFNEDNNVLVEDYGMMISIGNHTVQYPLQNDFNSVNNGIGITIYNKQNPTKLYYINVFGRIQAIPVKNSNFKHDCIVISNSIDGEEQVEEYPLTDMELLGIYTNVEDAREKCDASTRLRLKELEVKERSLSSQDISSDSKVKLENMKLDLEREKREHENFKQIIEKEKMELQKDIDNIQRDHDVTQMSKEKEILELKKTIEEIKSNTTKVKSSHDETGSFWKTVGIVIGAVATIFVTAWKIFF